MVDPKTHTNRINLPQLKPFVDVKDQDANTYTVYFDVTENTLKNGRKAELFKGEKKHKNGSLICIKCARVKGTAFSHSHIRVGGDIVTSAGEIAAQLNRLFAEE